MKLIFSNASFFIFIFGGALSYLQIEPKCQFSMFYNRQCGTYPRQIVKWKDKIPGHLKYFINLLDLDEVPLYNNLSNIEAIVY